MEKKEFQKWFFFGAIGIFYFLALAAFVNGILQHLDGETIFGASKRMRKKGGRIEIENRKHYVLCELKGKTLWVINAKRK